MTLYSGMVCYTVIHNWNAISLRENFRCSQGRTLQAWLRAIASKTILIKPDYIIPLLFLPYLFVFLP
jgi:hypothetical protein